MLTKRKILSLRTAPLCRECFNKRYHVKLKRTDFIYIIYPGECAQCHQTKHLVYDVRWIGKCKGILARG